MPSDLLGVLGVESEGVLILCTRALRECELRIVEAGSSSMSLLSNRAIGGRMIYGNDARSWGNRRIEV